MKDPNHQFPLVVLTDPDGSIRQLSQKESNIYWREQFAKPAGPPIGEWPERPPVSEGLSVARIGPREKKRIYIAIIPTADWTEIPAHLNWGGWNAVPQPEFHVAAFRSWRDRFGAELVGMSRDTLIPNIRVTQRPKDKASALELAREQYLYCSDVIDQGHGSYSMLAASLLANDWWWFWWD